MLVFYIPEFAFVQLLAVDACVILVLIFLFRIFGALLYGTSGKIWGSTKLVLDTVHWHAPLDTS